MPQWDFECMECGHIEREVFSPQFDVETARPTHCDKPMETLWDQDHAAGIDAFEAFETNNFEFNKTVRITSRRQLERLSQKYGVVPVDDPTMKMDGGRLTKKPAEGRKYFT